MGNAELTAGVLVVHSDFPIPNSLPPYPQPLPPHAFFSAVSIRFVGGLYFDFGGRRRVRGAVCRAHLCSGSCFDVLGHGVSGRSYDVPRLWRLGSAIVLHRRPFSSRRPYGVHVVRLVRGFLQRGLGAIPRVLRGPVFNPGRRTLGAQRHRWTCLRWRSSMDRRAAQRGAGR